MSKPASTSAKNPKPTATKNQSSTPVPTAPKSFLVADNAKVPPPPRKGYEPSRRDYGIEDAISLMRRLPDDDLRLIATVIKEALESANIKVSNILKDAEIKEARLEEQIKKLDSEIENLETMIHQRKDAIFELVRDLEETRRVKNNLALADGSYDVNLGNSKDGEKSSATDSKAPSDENSSAEVQGRALADEESSRALLESLFGGSGEDSMPAVDFTATDEVSKAK